MGRPPGLWLLVLAAAAPDRAAAQPQLPPQSYVGQGVSQSHVVGPAVHQSSNGREWLFDKAPGAPVGSNPMDMAPYIWKAARKSVDQRTSDGRHEAYDRLLGADGDTLGSIDVEVGSPGPRLESRRPSAGGRFDSRAGSALSPIAPCSLQRRCPSALPPCVCPREARRAARPPEVDRVGTPCWPGPRAPAPLTTPRLQENYLNAEAGTGEPPLSDPTQIHDVPSRNEANYRAIWEARNAVEAAKLAAMDARQELTRDPAQAAQQMQDEQVAAADAMARRQQHAAEIAHLPLAQQLLGGLGGGGLTPPQPMSPQQRAARQQAAQRWQEPVAASPTRRIMPQPPMRQQPQPAVDQVAQELGQINAGYQSSRFGSSRAQSTHAAEPTSDDASEHPGEPAELFEVHYEDAAARLKAYGQMMEPKSVRPEQAFTVEGE